MNKLNTSHGKWMMTAALAAALLAGCGGGGGESTEARGLDQNVSDLVVFMKSLIAMGEDSEAVDINPLSLAVDDSGDPAPL